MPNRPFMAVLASMLVVGVCAGFAASRSPAGEQRSIRMPADTVGYATEPGQIEAVIELSDSLEADNIQENIERFALMREDGIIGAIAPHDDYLYAGRIYIHALREIRTPLVILIGVCHAARRKGIQGQLIFESFDAWRGPYGDCTVSSLRDEIIGKLPEEMVLVSNELHAAEHSLEAFVPFLQYYNRDVRILPVLATRLAGPLFEAAADALAAAVHDIALEHDMALGDDYALLVSADCVHYGDDRWGGRDYAPFGVDREGYAQAVEQDLSIALDCLARPVDRKSISLFRERVERDDLQWPYKVTWCGVYSIPFGLKVLLQLAEAEGRRPPVGYLLRYGTSIDPGALPLEGTGLGVTNINTLRHWVGYAALGYW